MRKAHANTQRHTHLSTLTLEDRQSLYRRAQSLVRTRRLHVIYICFTFTNKIVLYCQLTTHTHTSVTPVIHILLYPQTKHLLFSSTSAYFNNFSRHGNTQRMTSGQIIKVTGQCVCQLRRVNPAALNHASNFIWITVLYFYCSPCWMTFKRSTYSSF